MRLSCSQILEWRAETVSCFRQDPEEADKLAIRFPSAVCNSADGQIYWSGVSQGRCHGQKHHATFLWHLSIWMSPESERHHQLHLQAVGNRMLPKCIFDSVLITVVRKALVYVVGMKRFRNYWSWQNHPNQKGKLRKWVRNLSASPAIRRVTCQMHRKLLN